jgi:REP element-mobilizing transposase RayT
MKYNPQIHHRRSIRLKGYDYSNAGGYFITICCHDRKCIFGQIVGAGFIPAPNDDNKDEEGQPQGIAPTNQHNVNPTTNTPSITPMMILNDYGKIAYNEWGKLPERFLNFELDVFVIMPNHMHGIIVLNQNNGTAATIGDIVGAYKSLVANECLKMYKSKGAGVNRAPTRTIAKLWQRNYYEHIIRNEQSYQTISDYIINNPAKWKDDKFFAS